MVAPHTPAYYRAKAKRCEALARQMRNDDMRARFEELARQWSEMADRAEWATGRK